MNFSALILHPPLHVLVGSWLVFPGWAETSWSFALGPCRLLQKIVLGIGKEIVQDLSSLPLSFLIFIVPEAAQVTFRTLSFRQPLRALSFFSIADVMFAISLSFHNSSLSRSVTSPRIEVPVYNFLTQEAAYHIIQSSIRELFSLLHCFMRIQCGIFFIERRTSCHFISNPWTLCPRS